MKKKKVLFISSTGGHLEELMQLKTMFDKYDYYIVTEKTKSNLGLREKYKGRISYLIYLSMVPSCILKGSIVTGTDYLKWYIPFRRKH